jgi:hypothetical protein
MHGTTSVVVLWHSWRCAHPGTQSTKNTFSSSLDPISQPLLKQQRNHQQHTQIWCWYLQQLDQKRKDEQWIEEEKENRCVGRAQKMVVMQCWGSHVTCTFFAAYITVAPCRYWYRLWTSKVIRSTRMQCILVQPCSYCGMNVQRG